MVLNKMSPVAFMREFARTRANVVCSEPVVAWAQQRGRLEELSRFAQLRLWRRLGAERGAEEIVERFRLSEIAPDAAREGDAVLLACEDGAKVVGLHAGGGFCVAATSGKVHAGRFAILRAWELL